MPKSAIILAAGRGARFRPITDSKPKPLVKLAEKTLIDWQLELLALSGVERVIINCCYLKEMLKSHVRANDYGFAELEFSDEETALETGGGIKKALPFFAGEPFFSINSDVVISPISEKTLGQLKRAHEIKPQLQVILLLQSRAGVVGLDSAGDFFCNEYGKISRRGFSKEAPFLYAGVQLLSPEIFTQTDLSIFSMNVIYDKMLETAPEKIAGVVNMQGMMLHVGDIASHEAAESFINQAAIP